MDAFQATASLAGGPVRSLQGTLSASMLGGGVQGQARGQQGQVEATLTARGLRVERLPADVRPQAVGGVVGGRVDLKGRLEQPLAVAAQLTGQGSAARLHHSASARASGTWDPQAGTVELRWKGQVDSRSQAPAAELPLRSSNLRADGRAYGRLPPRVEAQIQGQARLALPAGGEETVAIQGSAVGSSGELRAALQAQGNAGTAFARIAARGERVDSLELHGRGLRLDVMAAEAGGRIDVDATASGPWRQLSGTAAATASGVTWRGVEAGDVRLEAGLRDGSGQARVAAPALSLTAETSWTPQQDFDGRLVMEDTPLAPFAPLLGRDLDGRVAGQARFRGRAGRWTETVVTAEVSRAEVVSGNTYGQLTRPATFEVRDGRALITALEAEAQGARISAQGTVPLTSAGSFDLQARVQGQLDELDLPNAWNVSGDVDGQARVQGSRTQPQITGEVTARDVLVVSPAAGDAVAASRELRARFDSERAVIEDALIEVGGGEVQLSAQVPLAGFLGEAAVPPGPARVQASWAEVDLGAMAGATGRAATVDARISGRLELEAPLSAPAEAQGTIQLDAVTARVRDLTVGVTPVRIDVRSRQATLQPVQVTSAGSRLDLLGSADLSARTVRGSGHGELDLRALDPLLESGTISGLARIDVDVEGPLNAPRGQGAIVVEDGTLRLQEIPQVLSSIQGTARLAGDTLHVENASAQLGGGSLGVSGTARLTAAGFEDVRLDGTARDVSLRYPRDFKSRVHADLHLSGKAGDLLLSGQVRAERALYDTDIDLLEEAFRDRPEPPVAPPSPLLATVSLDLEALTENPILIRNNLAQIEATGRLRVVGDLLAPAPFGRLEVAPGGKVYVQTRDFLVESGSLTYTGSLDPNISVRAKTVVKELGTNEVEVTVTAQGALLSPEVRLSSNPSYSEKEIASLIASGRRNAFDNTTRLAGEHAALLVGGRLERRLERKFKSLGLDEVDIEPALLARQADPSARFTFGKYLTPNFKLIYSTGLADAEERFVEGQYRFRLGREITLKAQRDEEDIHSFGAGQRLRFGAPVPPRRGTAIERRRVSAVRLEGDLPMPEERLRAWLRVKPGKEVTYWDLQGDAERLENRLHGAGYLEALVTVRQEEAAAAYQVRAGARYDWRVSGLSSPPALQRELREAFSQEDALERGRKRLLEAAQARGYWRAAVETRVEGEGTTTRTLVFEVDPGPHIRRLAVTFPGAEALSTAKLLESAGGRAALIQEPEEARRRIEDEYRALYYLEAKVGLPRRFENETGEELSVEVPVSEGRQAVITAVEFPGASLDAAQLSSLAKVPLGEPYDFDASLDAVQRVRDHYLRAGYARVRVHPRPVPRGSDLILELEVHEGPRSTVGPTLITGLHRTRESLVRGRMQLEPGDPLDPRQLSVLERRLLDLDVFSRVVVTADEAERTEGTAGTVPIKVELEEEGPYAFAYDFRFSQEEKATGTVDAEVGNLLGLGLSLGARYRMGADLRELRSSLHLPSLGRTGDLTAAVFQTEEDFRILAEPPSTVPILGGRSFLDPVETEVQRGFFLQRATHPREAWDLLYGYRFKRITSRPERLDQTLSGVEFSAVNDRRDDPLDPTRGHFLSLSVEVAPRVMGSDFNFVRFLSQWFLTRELGPSWTWAQAYRLGLARGLEQQSRQQVEAFGRSTELFRAGGANTLRGYATDSVGPPGTVSGMSAGGEAMIILNQEVRYRFPFGIGAAVFWDAGNVFARVQDLDLKLRHSIGAGIRYESPVGLLRFNVGIPLDRRRGDSSYQWFFSLGQAF